MNNIPQKIGKKCIKIYGRGSDPPPLTENVRKKAAFFTDGVPNKLLSFSLALAIQQPRTFNYNLNGIN